MELVTAVVYKPGYNKDTADQLPKKYPAMD
jgi:hypothetical protein